MKLFVYVRIFELSRAFNIYDGQDQIVFLLYLLENHNKEVVFDIYLASGSLDVVGGTDQIVASFKSWLYSLFNE